MAEVRRFPYKGRILATFEASGGQTLITYESNQQVINNIKTKYGENFIYGNTVYIAEYPKGSNTLQTIPNGPAGDQNVLSGISNVDLVASMNNDPNFYKTATGGTTASTPLTDPNQPGTPGTSTPTSPPNQNPGASSAILKYPLKMKDDQDRIKFTVMRVAKSTAVNPSDAILATRPTFTPVSGIEPIFLPIQSGISDQNSVNWGPGEINELQRQLVNASIRIQRSGNNLGSVSTEEAKNVVDLFRDSIGSGLANIYFAEQAVGVQNLLSRVTGSIINPNLELLFQGPQLRPFNFTFKLSPRSSDEAKVVKKIINSFKKNMAPIFEDSGLFLKAPNVFKIEYQYGTSSPHPGLNLIKECALTNCSVDYTPNGTYMTYPEGTMVSYTLSLQFQEIEPIYSRDYTNPDQIEF